MWSKDSDQPGRATDGAEIRVYAELNDFLPPEWRYRAFSLPLDEETTIASLTEKIGIPLSDVDLVLKNSEPVGSPPFRTAGVSSRKEHITRR